MRAHWQSRLVLLLVLPIAGAELVLETSYWKDADPAIALWSFGITAFFAAAVLMMRAGTPAAVAAGFAIASSLIFSTISFSLSPIKSALTPACAVFALAALATRFGRNQKERFGLAESHSGRSAPQVAANLGAAMLFALPYVQRLLLNSQLWGPRISPNYTTNHALLFVPTLAALAEAAADTVSSEIGQALSLQFPNRFGTRTRLFTTLKSVPPGTNGGISLCGTLAGILAAAIVAAIGTWALQIPLLGAALALVGSILGLFADSLIGATLENKKLLNNDAVNFISTVIAALCALALLLIPA